MFVTNKFVANVFGQAATVHTYRSHPTDVGPSVARRRFGDFCTCGWWVASPERI